MYFRAGTTVTTFLDTLFKDIGPGELMFRNVTYAREVSMEVVVCIFVVNKVHMVVYIISQCLH